MRRRTEQARRREGGPRAWRPPARPLQDRLAGWVHAHAQGFSSSLGRLAARPVATALTLGVIAVALALPLALVTLRANLERLAPVWQDSGEIAVFLEDAVDAAAAEALAGRIAAQTGLRVELQAPEVSLAEFRELSGMAGILEAFDDNPLPWIVLVEPPRDAEDARDLVGWLAAQPGVDFVPWDPRWQARVQAWGDVLERGAQVLAGLLGLAVVLVIGNTVRLDLQGRAEELALLRLLGATRGYVRRPFLYLGALYGLGGALLALGLLQSAVLALGPEVAALADSYASDFRLRGVGWRPALDTLFAGGVLGWLGAFVVTGRQLADADRRAGL